MSPRRTNLAAGVLFAGCAATVSAELLVFDNTDLAFTWLPADLNFEPGRLLDIRLTPGMQTASGFTSEPLFGYEGTATTSGDEFSILSVFSTGAARVAVRSPAEPFNLPSSAGQTVPLPRVFEPGTAVGPEAAFGVSSTTSTLGVTTPFMFLGDGGVIGVSIEVDDATHFGWIELRAGQGGQTAIYQPVRWAFETVPGVPASVPAPGGSPCNAADVAPGFGALDVNDVIDFVNAFAAGGLLADVAPFPTGDGALNVNDIIDFVNAFTAGCPGA